METLWQILTDYGAELLTSAGVITAVLLGKPKTAEKIEKKRQKILERKKETFKKLVEKAQQKQQEIEELEKGGKK